MEAGEVKAGALEASDCTSPIFGTTYFADRYVFSWTSGEGVVISTAAAFVPSLFCLAAVQTQLDAASPGGPVARIPASGTFVLPRSEERRVGEDWRSAGEPEPYEHRRGSPTLRLAVGGRAPASDGDCGLGGGPVTVAGRGR